MEKPLIISTFYFIIKENLDDFYSKTSLKRLFKTSPLIVISMTEQNIIVRSHTLELFLDAFGYNRIGL